MYIHGYGSFFGPPADDIKYYKQEISRYTELSFRRANRFVLLSLLGACRCVNTHAIQKETSVYLTTENGNLGDTETVLDQIFHHHQFPMPYNFINTMSNTASFYVAQNLKLSGRNLTFSSKQLSFERGIELLGCDLLCGSVEDALIGGVDEACCSKRHLESKYRRPFEDVAMVEGSSWLLVRADPQNALGEIHTPETFGDLRAALDRLSQNRFARPVIASYGVLVAPREREAINGILPPAAAGFDHIGMLGYHDSVTACGATAFLARYSSGVWVHVGKDFRGRFTVLILEKY